MLATVAAMSPSWPRTVALSSSSDATARFSSPSVAPILPLAAGERAPRASVARAAFRSARAPRSSTASASSTSTEPRVGIVPPSRGARRGLTRATGIERDERLAERRLGADPGERPAVQRGRRVAVELQLGGATAHGRDAADPDAAHEHVGAVGDPLRVGERRVQAQRRAHPQRGTAEARAEQREQRDADDGEGERHDDRAAWQVEPHRGRASAPWARLRTAPGRPGTR